VSFLSRNQLNWTDRLSSLISAIKQLPFRQAFLDGELVALAPDGTSNFQNLQNAFRDGRQQDLVYYLFDLMFLDGWDLRRVALEERKDTLAALIKSAGTGGRVRYSDHIIGNASQVFRAAAERHLEGIICKRHGGAYTAGRSRDWLKIKCVQIAEFVIGGYTDPEGQRTGFGALLVGYHAGEKDLLYAGKVGTGFTGQTLIDLRARLGKMGQNESPFRDLQGQEAKALRAHWVKPRLVAQIRFGHWTREGRLRHATFEGLREDKSPRDVVREKPVVAARNAV
jgi:bifunctional non-homologous end joining protein LigD